MVRVIKTIAINGVETTMLFTPRLFVMAEKKGIKFILDTANIMETLAAYADICYCAALNHWTMDNDMEDFKLKRVDFHEWSAAEPKEFARVIALAAEALTGRTMKEFAKSPAPAPAEDEKKKKRKSNAITRLLRRFWSAIAG